MWNWIRRIKLEYKVYFVLFVLFVGGVLWVVYGSGWIQDRTFDRDIFSVARCELDKKQFDSDLAPRKSVEDVENIERLIPVYFYNEGKGVKGYGLIDSDGSVVVEGIYPERITYYGGYIRMVDDEGVKFYDVYGQLMDTRSVAPQYYEALRMRNLRNNILMDPAYGLINRRSLSSEFVSAIEGDVGLEIFYVSFFREPNPYYIVRFVHTSESVFGVYNGNLEQITQRYYTSGVFFDDTLVAKVESVCGTMYINYQGETVWMQSNP